MEKASYISIYTPFENFEKAIQSDETRLTYRYHLKGFLKFCKFDRYEQLLELSGEDLFNAISNYMNYRKASNVSYSDMNLTMSAIRLFFDMNRRDIPGWKQLSRIKGKARLQVDKQIYENEEMKTMLEHADMTEKVALLTLLTTGMRVTALAELRIGDVKYIEKFRRYKFIPYSKDINERYETFCTRECAQVIRAYHEDREKNGEILTADSPFLTHKTDSIRKFKRNGFYSQKTIAKMLERLRYDAHLETLTKIESKSHSESGRIRKQRPRAHVFRTIFNSQCIWCGVNHTVKEYFMGHKSGMALDWTYFKTGRNKDGDDKLNAEYEKVEEALTINEENKQKQRVLQLENERQSTEELKKQVQSLQEQVHYMAQFYDKYRGMVPKYRKKFLLQDFEKMGMYVPPKEAMEVYPADADEGVTSVEKGTYF